MKIGEYETHPASEVFPLLDGKDFGALVEDIRANGLNEEILLSEGLLLDGRNRLRACLAAGVAPRFREYQGDPWDLTWSANAERRHLAEGTRAAFRLKWKKERENWEESRRKAKAAADRARSENARPGPGRGRMEKRGKVSNNVVGDLSRRRDPERVEKEARAELARDANVSPATAQKAITVEKKAPELFEKVVSGEVTLNRAYRDVTRREATTRIESEPQPLPTGPFRVITADPPWAYTKRKDDGTHRSALSYPDMTTDEICALPVKQLAHDDAILWLWTTNAFMRDAFRVIDAWGFQEKTILTWAKDRMGTGDWLRGKTEHCIMAVRGKPLVNLTNQTTLLEGPVREHSRKPDQFYEMVEALCPGSKVELFARQPRDGWAVWGAETEKFSAA